MAAMTFRETVPTSHWKRWFRSGVTWKQLMLRAGGPATGRDCTLCPECTSASPKAFVSRGSGGAGMPEKVIRSCPLTLVLDLNERHCFFTQDTWAWAVPSREQRPRLTGKRAGVPVKAERGSRRSCRGSLSPSISVA